MTNHIQNLWSSLVPNHPNITTIHPISESRYHAVWKVHTSDQQLFAVKHHLFAPLTQGKPYDLIDVDNHVTSLLLADGVSVPRIIATHPERGLTIYEWSGEHTLDDLCQQHTHGTVANKVIETILTLESSFQKHAPQLYARVAPGSTEQETLTSFTEMTIALTDILPDLIHTLTNQTSPTLQTHWQNILHGMNDAPMSLGPTDYNARNIVLSSAHQPHILELAKIGYDWPERRLIQYTTSLGAHLPTGRMIGLITPQIAHTYAQKSSKHHPASAGQILTTLDRHHLIFYLFAALQCLQASTDPHPPWQNTNARLHDIQTALSIRFSNCKSTGSIRHLFQA